MEAIDLINQLLTVNHKKRIKSSDALKHPWFKIKINPGSPSKSRSQLEHDKIIKLLRNYSTQNRFQKETLKIFLNQMKDSEIKELHE